MPTIRFGQTDRSRKFDLLPPGSYLCRVATVEEQTTRKGDPMWRLCLVVSEGPFEGRRVFDRVVFSEAAQQRLEMFCEAFGIETEGEVSLVPGRVQDAKVFVQVTVEEYRDGEGNDREANAVAFDGYRKAMRGGEGDVPF